MDANVYMPPGSMSREVPADDQSNKVPPQTKGGSAKRGGYWQTALTMNRLLRKTLIFLVICCRLPSLLLVRMGKRTAYMLILVALQAHMQKGQRPLLQRQEVVNLPHPTIRNKKRNDNLLACLRLLRFRHMGRPETSFERIISRGTSILWLLSFWYA